MWALLICSSACTCSILHCTPSISMLTVNRAHDSSCSCHCKSLSCFLTCLICSSTTTPITITVTQPAMSQAGTSTTMLPPTTTSTIPTGRGGGGGGGGGGGIPAPPSRGGGGGGGGGRGGAAGGPPPTNGRLEGNFPFEFMGDRERSKAFMLAFEIYQGINPNTDIMTNPYK